MSSFMEEIAKGGGISTSNNFIVRFGLPIKFPNNFEGVGDINEKMIFFCDETQLPNVNTFDGTMNGVYQGSGAIKYPHTRVFTEIQMSFTLDANLGLLKFLNRWQDYIFNAALKEGSGKGAYEYERGESIDVDGQMTMKTKDQNRVTRLNYMNDYVNDIYIMKVEPGPFGDSQRIPMTYVLEIAYPYQIDAIPLQFGTTQQTKVTAQFTYARHYTVNQDIRNIGGFSTAKQKQLLKAQEDTGALDLVRPYQGTRPAGDYMQKHYPTQFPEGGYLPDGGFINT